MRLMGPFYSEQLLKLVVLDKNHLVLIPFFWVFTALSDSSPEDKEGRNNHARLSTVQQASKTVQKTNKQGRVNHRTDDDDNIANKLILGFLSTFLLPYYVLGS
jgi:hypothetical protein